GVALGFVLYWSEMLRPALRYLSIPIAMAGIPVLVAGALVHRKLEIDPSEIENGASGSTPAQEESRGLTPAVARLVGTATALTGVLVLMIAQGLAWPDPGALAGLGLFNFVALTTVALRYRLPPAHVPALVCLGVGVLAFCAYLDGS